VTEEKDGALVVRRIPQLGGAAADDALLDVCAAGERAHARNQVSVQVLVEDLGERLAEDGGDDGTRVGTVGEVVADELAQLVKRLPRDLVHEARDLLLDLDELPRRAEVEVLEDRRAAASEGDLQVAPGAGLEVPEARLRVLEEMLAVVELDAPVQLLVLVHANAVLEQAGVFRIFSRHRVQLGQNLALLRRQLAIKLALSVGAPAVGAVVLVEAGRQVEERSAVGLRHPQLAACGQKVDLPRQHRRAVLIARPPARHEQLEPACVQRRLRQQVGQQEGVEGRAVGGRRLGEGAVKARELLEIRAIYRVWHAAHLLLDPVRHIDDELLAKIK